MARSKPKTNFRLNKLKAELEVAKLKAELGVAKLKAVKINTELAAIKLNSKPEAVRFRAIEHLSPFFVGLVTWLLPFFLWHQLYSIVAICVGFLLLHAVLEYNSAIQQVLNSTPAKPK